MTLRRTPVDPPVAEAKRHPVTAFIDERQKETMISAEGISEMVSVTHTVDPEFTETKVRITGKLKTETSNGEPGVQLLTELIPYLETKINANIVTFTGMDFEILKQVDENTMNGKPIDFSEITEEMAFIIAPMKTKVAVLSSNEAIAEERRSFVFKDIDDAINAFMSFKTFPSFAKNYFYKKGRVCTLAEVDSDNLITEKFLFFDQWQKAVANLSAHMSKDDG